MNQQILNAALAMLRAEVGSQQEYNAKADYVYWLAKNNPEYLTSVVREEMARQASPQMGEVQFAGFFSSITKPFKNLVNHTVNTLKNPLKATKDLVKDVVTALPAMASAFSSGGGPWGAVAALAVSKITSDRARSLQNKANDGAQAEYQNEVGNVALDIATQAGTPEKAAQYKTRILAAADPATEVNKIIAEIAATGKTPAPGAAETATRAALAETGIPQSAVDKNATLKALGIGAAVLALVMIAAKRSK